MAYRLKASDSNLEQSVRRIASDRLDRAIAATETHDPDARRTAVHEIRKRIKEMRGLIRLLRSGFADFTSVDADLRQTARVLSPIRDAEVHVATARKLSEYVPQAEEPLAAYIRTLISHRDKIYASPADTALADVWQKLEALRSEAADWTVDGKDRRIVKTGVAKTYKAARVTMHEAAKTRSAEAMHEWRKQVKYHWYHCRLLKPVAPKWFSKRILHADTLGELLGDLHDLHVLADDARAAHLEDEHIRAFERAATDLIAQKEKEAFRLGKRLFKEKPSKFAEDFGARWDDWRD